MKIQITIDDKPMSGYLYISPKNGQNLYNLDNILSDNECLEIWADKILDYIPLDKIQIFVTQLLKKLRHGGKIILGGTDIYEVSKQLMNGKINTQDCNIIMYGSQKSTWDIKRSSLTLVDLSDLLVQLGLRITKKRIAGIEMIVEAIRD